MEKIQVFTHTIQPSEPKGFQSPFEIAGEKDMGICLGFTGATGVEATVVPQLPEIPSNFKGTFTKSAWTVTSTWAVMDARSWGAPEPPTSSWLSDWG